MNHIKPSNSEADWPDEASDAEGWEHSPAEEEGDPHRDRRVAKLRPPRRRRFARVVLSTLATFFLLAAAAVGALYWWIGPYPISAPMLTERVLRGIGENLPPGYSAALRGVSVARQEGGLVVLLHEFALDGPDGRPLAVAPSIAVGLDIPALLTGSIRPRRIQVDGAQAAIVVDVKGHIKLLAGQDSELSVASGLAALDGLLTASQSIDAVELRDAAVRVDDYAIGRKSVYQGLSLTVRPILQKKGLALAFAVKSGGSVNATIEALDGDRVFDLQAKGLSVQEVVRTLSPGTVVPNITAPLDASLKSRFGKDGTVRESTLAMRIGSGTWRVSPDVTPFAFDEAAVDIHWDAAQDMFLVDRLMMRAGPGIGNFTGKLTPPPEGAPPEWGVILDAPGLTLAGPRPQDAPLKLDVASLRGRYNPAIRRLGIDALEFSGPEARVSAQGSVTFEGRAPGFGLGVTGSRMPLSAMARLWPFMSAPKARAWFRENVKDGMMEGGSLTLAIPPDVLIPVDGRMPPLPDEAVAGEMVISGAAVNLFDTLPALEKASARVAFTGRQVHLTGIEGRVKADNGEPLVIDRGTFTLPDYEADPPIQHAAFHIGGSIAALTGLMKREPLSRSAEGLSALPTQMSGKADIGVKVVAPLIKDPPEDQVDYKIDGVLSDLDATLSNGSKLNDAHLSVKADRGTLDVTGAGQLAGLPAAVSYKKAGGSAPSVELKLTLDDAARTKRGFGTGAALTGPIAISVAGRNAKSGPFDIEVDLTATRIRDFLPGWQKAPGKAAKMTMSWVPKESGGEAQDIALESGSVSLRGDANFTETGALKKIALKSFRLSPGDDAQAIVEPAPGGGWKANLRARSFDLRPALKMADRREGDQNADLNLDVKIDKAQGFGNEILSGFTFTLETKGPLIRRLEARGRLGSTAIAAVQQTAQDGTSQIVVETADAGSLLRFFDYYTRVEGGIFQAAFAPRMDSTQGIVIVRNFAVVNEPALGQFFSQARTRDERFTAQAGAQTQFTEMKLNFSRTPDRLRIVEAKIYGPAVGANVKGEVDYTGDRVSLAGTFVPAYALNNLPSRLLPGIGDIFTGGRNGGLFAVTFKISGPVASPTLTVNPLSAIAPGFLRGLFEYR